MKTTYRKRNQPPRRRNLLPVAVLLVVLVAAAIIAVALGALIDLLQKRVVPRGLRKEAEK